MEHILPFMTNHWALCAALVVILILIFLVEQGTQLGGATAISPTAAVAMINHQDATVIDIRNTDTYRNGHIIEANNMTITDIENKPQKIEKYKNKPVILVCANGQESSKIAARLKKQGFNQVVSIKGGITAWISAELPLAK